MTNLINFKSELEAELENILEYWMQHSVDHEHGGFYGRINNENGVDTGAPKGLVLNARILWTFSAAYRFKSDEKYLVIAKRALQYLQLFFHDPLFGGYYWSVDKWGQSLETKKQVYGIAFCCYAFSEYYRSTSDAKSLDCAKECYSWIEQYAFDNKNTGYLEAFSREWQQIADLRLSAKDANEKKTMNTHLHVLEAYSNLYRVWPDEALKNAICRLLKNFSNQIVEKQTGHLQLFFDENWNVKGEIISYGHDIEAAWLLLEAAEAIGDTQWIEITKPLALQLAEAARAGLDTDGGLWYEMESGSLVNQKHSWPQAEAMVGFFNAWQLGGENKYLDHALKSWQFIQQNILDKENGEWFWGINEDGSLMPGQDKVGFWKCPYHSSRACMEVIRRVKEVLKIEN